MLAFAAGIVVGGGVLVGGFYGLHRLYDRLGEPLAHAEDGAIKGAVDEARLRADAERVGHMQTISPERLRKLGLL